MIKAGKYQHFKGGQYEVIGIAKHSETLEDLVIYKEIPDGEFWARPEKMFLEEVDFKGKKVQRFKYIG
jgi:hypothetical protein